MEPIFEAALTATPAQAEAAFLTAEAALKTVENQHGIYSNKSEAMRAAAFCALRLSEGNQENSDGYRRLARVYRDKFHAWASME